MKEKVVVLKVDNYNPDVLRKKIEKAVNEYFVLDEIFKHEDKIVLKPNLLMPADPETAITTNPVFVETVGQIFKNKGFEINIADNSSAVNNVYNMDLLYIHTH